MQADQMITVIHLRVMRTLALCMDLYLETLSVLIPLLTNFAVAVFTSNHAYTLLQ